MEPQFLAAARECYGAAFHDVGALGQAQRQRRELLDQQNADAALGNCLYGLGEPADDGRC